MQHHALRAARVVDAERAVAERGDPRGERPGRAREGLLQARARQHRLAGRVERDEVEREPGGEDPVRRLGIHVHVELGGRRDVARHVHGAAHRHDAADELHRRRVRLERERQVRHGPERDDRQEALLPPGAVEDQRHGGGELAAAHRRPVVEVAEAVRAVVARSRHELPGERLGRADRDHRRRVGLAQGEEPADVRGGLLDRHVPRDRRDHLDDDLRRVPRGEERERVVDPGVGVDEQGRCHGPSLIESGSANLPALPSHRIV